MEYRVDESGSKGDGKTDDGAAIQAVIDTCSHSGGGKVILSQGKTYLSSSIVLKRDVELHLEKGSILKASTSFDRFVKPSKLQYPKYPRQEKNKAHKPGIVWLYAFDQDNISISGEGIIEGNADSVTKRVNQYYIAGNGLPRPTLIYFENCRKVTVTGITLRKAPFWTFHLAGCADVDISKIHITNSLECANSDGIDPDHCKNVTIRDCHIECADDCIAIKNTRGNTEYGPCEHIMIKDCQLISTSAAIKIGTESLDDFNHITVSGCTISKSNRGISLQLRDNGNIENVTFTGIHIDTRRFSTEWWGSGEPIAITAIPRYPFTKGGVIKNIRFSGITCDSENGVLIYAKKKNHIRDIFFENITINLSVKSKWYNPSYDLRPGFMTGILKRNITAFFSHKVENLSTTNVSIKEEGKAETSPSSS